MSRNYVPMGILDAQGNQLPTDPNFWQFKGNKGGETYLKYVAYARPGVGIDEAGWLISENTQDSSGNLIARKMAVTGNEQQGKFGNLFDASVGIAISAITKASPAEVTTTAAHGLSTGDKVEIVGVAGMTSVNSDITNDARGDGTIVFTITKVDATKFTLGVDSSAYGVYTSGGTAYSKSVFGLTFA